MDRNPQPGLEVTSHDGPEIVLQPEGNKYYTGSSELNEFALSQPDKPIHSVSKTSRNKAFWALAVIAIVCLAVALGAGLGAGLSTKRKSSTSSIPIITVTQSGNIFTTTQAPAITSTAPSTSTTTSPVCPAANGSSYIATNKPSSSLGPEYVISGTSLTYQILCNTNFRTNNITAAVDMQIINNVTSLKECLDACALYSFQTPPNNFPALGCSGAVWSHNTLVLTVG